LDPYEFYYVGILILGIEVYRNVFLRITLHSMFEEIFHVLKLLDVVLLCFLKCRTVLDIDSCSFLVYRIKEVKILRSYVFLFPFLRILLIK
jgi:hypothetical protein